jgi:hypothetical protein
MKVPLCGSRLVLAHQSQLGTNESLKCLLNLEAWNVTWVFKLGRLLVKFRLFNTSSKVLGQSLRAWRFATSVWSTSVGSLYMRPTLVTKTPTYVISCDTIASEFRVSLLWIWFQTKYRSKCKCLNNLNHYFKWTIWHLCARIVLCLCVRIVNTKLFCWPCLPRQGYCVSIHYRV